MTREERGKAIEHINDILTEATEHEDSVSYVTSEDAKWLRLAIEALKQESCDDCISRKDTLSEFKRVYFDNDTVIRCAELVLGGMPPVKPQYTEAEIQKMQELEQAEIEKAYELGKAEQLNKRIPASEREHNEVRDKGLEESEADNIERE